MNFSAEQISPRKWGIYSNSKLLATVSSEAICKTVMANIASGRRDLPSSDVNAIYQISAELRPPLVKATTVSATSARAISTGAVSTASISTASISTSPTSAASAAQTSAQTNTQVNAQANNQAQAQARATISTPSSSALSIEDMLDLLSEKQLEDVLFKVQKGSIEGVLEAVLAG